MDIFKPDTSKKKVQLPAPVDHTMTLLLGNKNKVLYYLGDLAKPLEGPTVTGYGKDSLDKVLTTTMARIKDTSAYLIVLVKPSDKSNYNNFVKALDVIKTTGVKSYGVVDITSNEVTMLKKYKAY